MRGLLADFKVEEEENAALRGNASTYFTYRVSAHSVSSQ